MKPVLLKINNQPESSFHIREDNLPNFPGDVLYHHPEIEIMTVLEGTGTRFIGDNIETFEPGEVILLGSNIPHMWRSDEKYFKNNSRLRAKSILIQFRENFLGDFFNAPEAVSIKLFLKRTSEGFKLKGRLREKVRNMMFRMVRETIPFLKLMLLFEMLFEISKAKTNELHPLVSKGYRNDYSDSDTFRIGEIYNYALKNHTKKISIEEIANVANMSPNSFCRYFKSKTRITFSQFLIDIRIAQACKMIVEDRLTIAQICYKSGFQNLSNFNRKFKKKTKLTPFQYKHKFILSEYSEQR